MLIWLKTAAGAVGLEEGVVRAEDVQTLVSVQELQFKMEQSVEQALSEARQQAAEEIEVARAQARQIVEDAHQEAERLRQAAYEEGTRQAVGEWHERHLQATIEHQRAMRDMHARLADVVTSAVERIVLCEDRRALYQRALKSVQSLTRGGGSLKLRVGMDDYAQARDCIGEIDNLQEAGLELEVLADGTLPPGSCIFESDLGVLDASLQTQLAGLRAAMERAVRRCTGDALSAVPSDAAPHEVPVDDPQAASHQASASASEERAAAAVGDDYPPSHAFTSGYGTSYAMTYGDSGAPPAEDQMQEYAQ